MKLNRSHLQIDELANIEALSRSWRGYEAFSGLKNISTDGQEALIWRRLKRKSSKVWNLHLTRNGWAVEGIGESLELCRWWSLMVRLTCLLNHSHLLKHRRSTFLPSSSVFLFFLGACTLLLILEWRYPLQLGLWWLEILLLILQ